mmetsp:Transcript_42571/g.96836  ORF Transcript_42571/g.96836 Transcript_42571/m.96836 type:complete len:208 (-) Transcript_42571:561-1184(-)
MACRRHRRHRATTSRIAFTSDHLSPSGVRSEARSRGRNGTGKGNGDTLGASLVHHRYPCFAVTCSGCAVSQPLECLHQATILLILGMQLLFLLSHLVLQCLNAPGIGDCGSAGGSRQGALRLRQLLLFALGHSQLLLHLQRPALGGVHGSPQILGLCLCRKLRLQQLVPHRGQLLVELDNSGLSFACALYAFRRLGLHFDQLLPRRA